MKLKNNKGQVLVIVLGLVVLLYVLTLFIVETGHFVTTKMHLQNTSDSVAMESGIWYARSLNLTSLVNKVRYVTGFIQNAIDDLLYWLLDEAYDHILSHVCPGKVLKALCKAVWKTFEKYAVPFVSDLIDDSLLAPVEALDQTVAKVQIQFKRNIPVIFVYTNAVKDLALSGSRDGIYCFPCFSGILPSLDIFTDYERMKKIKVQYEYYDRAAKKTKTAPASSVKFDPKANKWKLNKAPYYYVDRVVKTNKDKSRRDADKAAKKSIEEIEDETAREAAKEELESTILTQYTYIEETGKQEIYVLCFQKYKPIIAAKFWPEKWLVAASKVRIEGGSMSVFDFGGPSGGGAHYFPRLENVGVSEAFEKVETSLGFIDKTLGKAAGFSLEQSGFGEFVNVMTKVDH